MYNAELQMLREFINWALPQYHCYFCKESMMSSEEGEAQGFGHRRHRKFHRQFTLHHLNQDREDNGILTNVVICHAHCHTTHHRKEKSDYK